MEVNITTTYMAQPIDHYTGHLESLRAQSQSDEPTTSRIIPFISTRPWLPWWPEYVWEGKERHYIRPVLYRGILLHERIPYAAAPPTTCALEWH